jgi:hypothetical protein
LGGLLRAEPVKASTIERGCYFGSFWFLQIALEFVVSLKYQDFPYHTALQKGTELKISCSPASYSLIPNRTEKGGYSQGYTRSGWNSISSLITKLSALVVISDKSQNSPSCVIRRNGSCAPPQQGSCLTETSMYASTFSNVGGGRGIENTGK